MPLRTHRLLQFLVLQFLCTANLLAQATTAVPLLMERPSSAAAGMGTLHSLFLAEDPMSLAENPAFLGLLPGNGAGGSLLLKDVRISPVVEQIVLSSGGAWGGFSLEPYLGLPLSVGAGYLRTRVDYGSFFITGPGPTPLETFDAYEAWDGYSLGIGLHLPVTIACGVTVKQIQSHLAGMAAWFEMIEGKTTATDIGLIARAPLLEDLCSLTGADVRAALGIRPMLNVGFSAAWSNVGGEITYIDPDQADPIPRTAALGVAAEGGFFTVVDEEEWRLLTVMGDRQAVDVLVAGRDPRGATIYKSVFGDLELFPNLFGGERAAGVQMKEGGELGLLEALFIRRGQEKGGWSESTSSGFSIRWRGLWKLAKFLMGRSVTHGLFARVADRVNIQYHNSTQHRTTASAGAFDRKYSGISLWIRI